MKLFRSKKGLGEQEQGMSWSTVVSLVLAGIIVFSTIPLWGSPLKLLFTDKDEQVSNQAFDTFISALEVQEAEKIMLKTGYQIMGFSKDYEKMTDNDPCPLETCVCLYHNKKPTDECIKFDGINIASKNKPHEWMFGNDYDIEEYYPLMLGRIDSDTEYELSFELVEKNGKSIMVVDTK